LRDAATFVFGRNRLNNPVSNYENDLRIHSVSEDPHASAYLSNTVNLQQPAESLKVILTAYRNSSSDFRVLYKLTRSDSSEIDQTYELFNTDGTSDVRVRASEDGEYLEYEFTADNLPQFTGFAIKIVMSGTNEAYSTKFRDLRAIALA